MINIQNDISLKNFNTFGINTYAKFFVEIKTKEELTELLSHPIFINEKHFILGYGANILFSSDFAGLIIKSNINFIDIVNEDDKYVYVNVGSGVVWNDFINFAITNSLSGIENLIDIPSQCGSAVVQNIGAYGMEICNNVEKVFAIEMFGNHNEICFNNNDCDFAYRNSFFKKKENRNKYYITNVIFKLKKHFVPCLSYKDLADKFKEKNPESISMKEISSAVSEIRRSKLPDYKKCGNAGSFFKNPVVNKIDYLDIVDKYGLKTFTTDNTEKIKLSAAQLIELAGLKGKKNGDAGISAEHSLVMCNYGNATGQEIIDYANFVIDTIKQKFGVVLEPEVIII